MKLDTILLVGSGRLARHLKYWNSLLLKPNHLIFWDRSVPVSNLGQLIEQASIVWLAISDSALVPFYEQNLLDLKIPGIHFSGAIHDSRMLSAHPLMSFPTDLLPVESYPKIHFTLTGATNLLEIMPGFSNSFSVLPAQDKALYHALCVVSGNFPQLLWSEAFPQLAQLQIPEQAIEFYIRQITENYIQFKNRALTGPLIRKDLNTIEKNMVALPDSKLKKVYQSFAEEFTK